MYETLLFLFFILRVQGVIQKKIKKPFSIEPIDIGNQSLCYTSSIYYTKQSLDLPISIGSMEKGFLIFFCITPCTRKIKKKEQ
jgi:hypothetical protein